MSWRGGKRQAWTPNEPREGTWWPTLRCVAENVLTSVVAESDICQGTQYPGSTPKLAPGEALPQPRLGQGRRINRIHTKVGPRRGPASATARAGSADKQYGVHMIRVWGRVPSKFQAGFTARSIDMKKHSQTTEHDQQQELWQEKWYTFDSCSCRPVLTHISLTALGAILQWAKKWIRCRSMIPFVILTGWSNIRFWSFRFELWLEKTRVPTCEMY